MMQLTILRMHMRVAVEILCMWVTETSPRKHRGCLAEEWALSLDIDLQKATLDQSKQDPQTAGM